MRPNEPKFSDRIRRDPLIRIHPSSFNPISDLQLYAHNITQHLYFCTYKVMSPCILLFPPKLNTLHQYYCYQTCLSWKNHDMVFTGRVWYAWLAVLIKQASRNDRYMLVKNHHSVQNGRCRFIIPYQAAVPSKDRDAWVGGYKIISLYPPEIFSTGRKILTQTPSFYMRLYLYLPYIIIHPVSLSPGFISSLC